LFTTNTTTNMHLFDAKDKLRKYSNVCEMIDGYFDTRLELYQTRKDYMIRLLSHQLLVLSNKARYIKENLDGTVDLRKKKKEEVVQLLLGKEYDIIEDDNDFKYLTKLPMDSVTEENVAKLMNDHGDKLVELETVKSKTIQQMWLRELELLEIEYVKYREERERSISGATKKVVARKIKLVVEK